MNLIMKPTYACNCACLYCSSPPGPLPALMEIKTLNRLFGELICWLRTHPTQEVTFIWHGGEPLLPGLAYYQEIRELQKTRFGELISRVKNEIQSNLISLTPDWLPFLTDFLRSRCIGTSYDCIPGIRVSLAGGGLEARWKTNVELLIAAGFTVGVVYVVHRQSLNRVKHIYDFFRMRQGISLVRYNPIYAQGRARKDDSLLITAEEYGRFLLELCDLWASDGLPSSIRPLGDWHQIWIGALGEIACDCSGGCQENFLAVTPDGSVYGCGLAAENPGRCYGNINATSLETLLNHPLRIELAKRGPLLRSGPCKDCPYWHLCHGGCPALGTLYNSDPFTQDSFCKARKTLFSKFHQMFGPPNLRGKYIAGRPVTVSMFMRDAILQDAFLDIVSTESRTQEFLMDPEAYRRRYAMSLTDEALAFLVRHFSYRHVESAHDRPTRRLVGLAMAPLLVAPKAFPE